MSLTNTGSGTKPKPKNHPNKNKNLTLMFLAARLASSILLLSYLPAAFHTALMQQRKLQIVVRPCMVESHSIWQFQEGADRQAPLLSRKLGRWSFPRLLCPSGGGGSRLCSVRLSQQNRCQPSGRRQQCPGARSTAGPLCFRQCSATCKTSAWTSRRQDGSLIARTCACSVCFPVFAMSTWVSNSQRSRPMAAASPHCNSNCRMPLAEHSDSELRHFDHLQEVSLEGCIAYRYNCVRSSTTRGNDSISTLVD